MSDHDHRPELMAQRKERFLRIVADCQRSNMSQEQIGAALVKELGALSQYEVAKVLRMTRQRVQQIEQRALAKLARNKKARQLMRETG